MQKATWRTLGLLALLAALAVGLAQAQVITPGGIVVPTLKQQLTTGLLARTPQEQAFVDQVVTMVNTGQLPLSMVQGTFLWARKKQPFPMPFFQQALILRANAAGIKIP